MTRESSSEHVEDLIAAFTEEVEAANAQLADMVRDSGDRLAAEVAGIRATIDEIAATVDALGERVAALEARQLSPPSAGGASEAELKVRFRHPEIWAMVEKGTTPEEIARASSRPIGEIRLIVRLMGRDQDQTC